MSNTRKIKTAKPATRPTNSVDLDAMDAEANAEPFTFTFGGKEYELPNHALWTLDDMQVLNEQGLLGILATFLGEDTAATISSTMRVGQFRALDSALGAHITGAGTGE